MTIVLGLVAFLWVAALLGARAAERDPAQRLPPLAGGGSMSEPEASEEWGARREAEGPTKRESIAGLVRSPRRAQPGSPRLRLFRRRIQARTATPARSGEWARTTDPGAIIDRS